MSSKIKILADKNIMLAQHHLPDEVALYKFDPVQGIPDDAGSYDALFVRTVCPVGEHTIPESPEKLRFIGSATAGIDHVDQEWLEKNGIRFACSPGCNADSVAEYIATALVIWSLKTNTDLMTVSFGIVGAGHTGSAVGRILDKLGVKNISYDPPKEEREQRFESATLTEVLDCDILSFHTPLTMQGPWPTYYWLDLKKLLNRHFKLIINTARGGVINEFELHRAYRRRDVGSYILDVWENEPLFNDRVAFRALIRTPHIAGYSLQAKSRATDMILDAFCDSFDLEPATQGPEDDLPPPPEIPDNLITSDLLELLCTLHPIGEYKIGFDRIIGSSAGEKSRGFQEIRTGYPLRHEFPYIKLGNKLLKRYPLLGRLGFGRK